MREDSNQKKPPWEGYGKDNKRQEPLIRRQEVRVKEMRSGKFRHPIPPLPNQLNTNTVEALLTVTHKWTALITATLTKPS